MKVRESGMPEEAYWETLFDVPLILERLGVDARVRNVVEFGCGGHLDALFQVAQADGALSSKEKVFIGLGISLVTHCEPCILVHMGKALAAGASRAEILEACGVAIAMGGGPTMVHVPLVLNYLKERG